MNIAKLAVAASMVVGISSGAHALTYTQSATVTSSKTDFSTLFTLTKNGASANLFAGFIPVVGTLNDVVVTFTASGTETGTLTNTSNTAQTFKFATSSSIYASDAGSSAPSSLLAFIGAAGGLTLNSPSTSYTLAAQATTAVMPSDNAFNPSSTSITTTFTGSDAAQFINNNFSLKLNTLTGSSFLGGGGNIQTALTTMAGGTLTISYDYSAPSVAVPEPSSLAVLGAGLIGIGFIRRRQTVA